MVGLTLLSIHSLAPLVKRLRHRLPTRPPQPATAGDCPPPKEIEDFLQTLGRVTTIVRPKETVDLITVDPPNNQLLEVAPEAEADYIVSRDRHLLELREFRGTAIVSPAQFIVLLRRPES